MFEIEMKRDMETFDFSADIKASSLMEEIINPAVSRIDRAVDKFSLSFFVKRP